MFANRLRQSICGHAGRLITSNYSNRHRDVHDRRVTAEIRTASWQVSCCSSRCCACVSGLAVKHEDVPVQFRHVKRNGELCRRCRALGCLAESLLFPPFVCVPLEQLLHSFLCGWTRTFLSLWCFICINFPDPLIYSIFRNSPSK